MDFTYEISPRLPEQLFRVAEFQYELSYGWFDMFIEMFASTNFGVRSKTGDALDGLFIVFNVGHLG